MGKERHQRLYDGVGLTGLQYEALCRYVISVLYKVPIGEIRSGYVAGPSQRRQELRHQIDLYWTASDGVCEYTVFANAKWRTHSVQVGDLMEVVGVWRDIGFHKAMIITNSGFDVGVIKQAEAKGIALLIVRPVVDLSGIGRTNLPAVVEEVVGIAKGKEPEEVFEVEVVHKGVGEWARGRGGEGEKVRGGVGERAGGGVGRGLGEGEREGEGKTPGAVEGVDELLTGPWLVGCGGDGCEIEGVEDKSMGSGQVSDKMMGGGGVWKKG